MKGRGESKGYSTTVAFDRASGSFVKQTEQHPFLDASNGIRQIAKSEPKGFWIVHFAPAPAGDHDLYLSMLAPVLAEYGAKFIVRDGCQEVVEGAAQARTVVIEFPSLIGARDCFNSAEYSKTRHIRHFTGFGNMIIAEGT